MTTLDAILLGIVQGLTEFLPVSSSGHLKLMQYLLGMKDLDRYIPFDLVCHLGTLLAIALLFFQNIKQTLQKDHSRLFQIVLGTLPLVPLVFLMKPIKAAYSAPDYLGYFFLATAAILFLGAKFGRTLQEAQTRKNRWRDAVAIGCWQAAAILPGVSRSGSTITGARLLGWDAKDAVVFSFLLAIPAIFGGSLIELFKLWNHSESGPELAFIHYLAGFTASFLTGLFALKLLMQLAVQNKLYYFAWYCLILGLATVYYFN